MPAILFGPRLDNRAIYPFGQGVAGLSATLGGAEEILARRRAERAQKEAEDQRIALQKRALTDQEARDVAANELAQKASARADRAEVRQSEESAVGIRSEQLRQQEVQQRLYDAQRSRDFEQAMSVAEGEIARQTLAEPDPNQSVIDTPEERAAVSELFTMARTPEEKAAVQAMVDRQVALKAHSYHVNRVLQRIQHYAQVGALANEGEMIQVRGQDGKPQEVPASQILAQGLSDLAQTDPDQAEQKLLSYVEENRYKGMGQRASQRAIGMVAAVAQPFIQGSDPELAGMLDNYISAVQTHAMFEHAPGEPISASQDRWMKHEAEMVNGVFDVIRSVYQARAGLARGPLTEKAKLVGSIVGQAITRGAVNLNDPDSVTKLWGQVDNAVSKSMGHDVSQPGLQGAQGAEAGGDQESTAEDQAEGGEGSEGVGASAQSALPSVPFSKALEMVKNRAAFEQLKEAGVRPTDYSPAQLRQLATVSAANHREDIAALEKKRKDIERVADSELQAVAQAFKAGGGTRRAAGAGHSHNPADETYQVGIGPKEYQAQVKRIKDEREKELNAIDVQLKRLRQTLETLEGKKKEVAKK